MSLMKKFVAPKLERGGMLEIMRLGEAQQESRTFDASWILSSSEEMHRSARSGTRREVACGLLHNFASRSLVDQIAVGKSIVWQYYRKDAHHSYWNGCSTGELLDGVLANAPAINFVNLLMGELWPQQVMKKANMYLSNCELDFFRAEAIKACELDNSVKPGVLHEPEACHWSPSSLVGVKFACDGRDVKEMAQVVQDIHDGPVGSSKHNKFPGLAWGVPMTTLANITLATDGTRRSNPFAIAASWLQKVVLRNEGLFPGTMDEAALDSLWVAAQVEFGGLLHTDDPNLSRLRDSGTKLLTWHGINDQMIPFQNTINYRRKVEAIMGAAYEVDNYYRVFLAPGVEHCGGGIGPVPKDPLEALVNWVEHDEPPETLDAEILDHEGDLVTQDLCLWPGVSHHMGIGNVKRASSWSCIGGTERPVLAEQVVQQNFEYGSMQQPWQVNPELDANEEKKHPDRAGQFLGDLKDRLEGLGMGLLVE
ncbi:tannase and feruloyl esterase [Setomelanomma holmii]|uniref:Carboxylic ester hydrolase n=1 Tax=Setomelanomma holmii TaxID=210430 RepID=A0A9P4LIT9_9PLEO|nr:tannase and feruloyl esterase [Setomelanomma holmii]